MSLSTQSEATSKPVGELSEGEINDKVMGLPALRTWSAVYVFVLGILVLWVALLAALPRFFS